jgi:hypothetical protein
VSRRAILCRAPAGAIGHWCPGCRTVHYLGERFQWDGDEAAPTFMPDNVVLRWSGDCEAIETVCHYMIVGGVISYLPRTTHELRGRRVPLSPLPPGDAIGATADAMAEIAAAMRAHLDS